MFDFPRYARDHGVEIAEAGQHHHAHRGWVQTHCPFCTDGSHGFHLGWNTSSGNLSCWRHGFTRLLEYLTTRHSPEEARRLRRQYETQQATPNEVQHPDVVRRQIEAIRERGVPTPIGVGPLKKAHRKYLRSRGFNSKKLEKTWELQGTTWIGKPLWTWRVVGPVRDIKGEVVAYMGRAIGKHPSKYVYTEADLMRIPSEELLYGVHLADRKKGVVVVEGPADAWRIGPGAVAVNGIKWRKEQATILRRFRRRFIMFDPEPEAQNKAEELAEYLSMFKGSTEVISGLKCDPGDLDPGEVRKIRRELGI